MRNTQSLKIQLEEGLIPLSERKNMEKKLTSKRHMFLRKNIFLCKTNSEEMHEQLKTPNSVTLAKYN